MDYERRRQSDRLFDEMRNDISVLKSSVNNLNDTVHLHTLWWDAMGAGHIGVDRLKMFPEMTELAYEQQRAAKRNRRWLVGLGAFGAFAGSLFSQPLSQWVASWHL